VKRLVTTAVVVALALPAGAAAQSSPFAPLPAPQQQQTVAPTPVQRSLENDGLESWQQILILIAAVTLLGGIAWAIVHDAHRRAPALTDAQRHQAELQGERVSAQRKAKARQKTKAQRKARRANR
jgi:hypothetical protein